MKSPLFPPSTPEVLLDTCYHCHEETYCVYLTQHDGNCMPYCELCTARILKNHHQ